MIYPGLSNPEPEERPDGTFDPKVKYDVGVKFRRFQWEVRPVIVVEATPKIAHVYSKRMIYLDGITFKGSAFEYYDRQGQLWRQCSNVYGRFKGQDGYNYPAAYFVHWYDLQKDHMTSLTNFRIKYNKGARIEEDYTLKKMLEMGR